jgi:GNAT superfamily N-acetyltransferase
MTTRVSSTGSWPAIVSIAGASVTLRPLTADDKTALLQFFQRVPSPERLYLKEDVTSPAVIDRWVRELDYTRVLPLLAWDGDRIIGDGTLHRSRAEARRHIGELRIVIDPDYRNRGVGRTLLQALVDVARVADPQLEKLMFEVVSDTERAATHTAVAMGFVKAATFSAHIRYVEGEPHDLHVYELQFGEESVLDDPAAHMY